MEEVLQLTTTPCRPNPGCLESAGSPREASEGHPRSHTKGHLAAVDAHGSAQPRRSPPPDVTSSGGAHPGRPEDIRAMGCWLFWLGLYWFWFSSVGVFLIGHILSWCYVSCCRLSCYWGLFLFLKFCIRVVLRVRILFWFLVRYCWSCVNNFLWDLVDLSFFFLFLFLRNINWTEWFPVALSFLSGNKLLK